MVQNETQETIEKSQIDFLVGLGEDCLHHDITFTVCSFPDIRQVIYALTPLIDKQRRRFGIGGFDPRWE